MAYLRPTEKFVHERRLLDPELLAEHLAWMQAIDEFPFEWFITCTFRLSLDEHDIERAFANAKKRICDDICGRRPSYLKFWGVAEHSESRHVRPTNWHFHMLVTGIREVLRPGNERSERWKDPSMGFAFHLQKVSLMTSYNGVVAKNRIHNLDIKPITSRDGAVDYLLKGLKKRQLIVMADSDLAFT